MFGNVRQSSPFDGVLIDARNERPLTIALATIIAVWSMFSRLLSRQVSPARIRQIGRAAQPPLSRLRRNDGLHRHDPQRILRCRWPRVTSTCKTRRKRRRPRSRNEFPGSE